MAAQPQQNFDVDQCVKLSLAVAVAVAADAAGKSKYCESESQ